MDKHKVGEPPPGGGEIIQPKKSKNEMLTLKYSNTDVGPYQVMIESANAHKFRTNSQKDTAASNNSEIIDNSMGDVNSGDEETASQSQNATQGENSTAKSQQGAETLHIGNFSHLSVAKTILDMKLDDVIKMEKKGRNRLCIIFRTYQAANDFLNNQVLLDRGYAMFIPSNLISCKGIVRYIDRDITTDEIVNNAKAYDIKIISAKRLNRRVVNKEENKADFVPTSTVLFTFSGQVLPRFINIYGLPMPVEPYILPVIQCQNCFLYGHTKKNCNGQIKCKICAVPVKKHSGECKIKCMHCDSTEHSSNSRKCTEYNRQKLIRQIMSLDNLSYFDANLRVPKSIKNIEYHHQQQDFPSLPKQQPINVIHVNERRNYSPQVTNYSRVVRKRIKPSSPTELSPGYDKEAHDACLINPNGRMPNMAHPTIQGSDNRPLQPETTENNVIDMLDSIVNMTEPEREFFLKELSNRFNLKFNYSNAKHTNTSCSSSNQDYSF